MKIALTAVQRFFFIVLVCLSSAIADISVADKNFLIYSDKNMKNNTNNNPFVSSEMKEANNIANLETLKMLEEDTLSVNKYKKTIYDSYDKGFAKAGKEEVNKEIDALENMYPDNKKELETHRKKLLEAYNGKNISAISKKLENIGDLKIEVLDDDKKTKKIVKVFDSKKAKSKASNMKKAQTSSMKAFSCLCESVLQKAFKDIDNKINSIELSGLFKSLEEMKESVKNNIKTQTKENEAFRERLNKRKHEIAILKMITLKIK